MRLEDVNSIKQEAATTFMNVIAAIFVTIKSGRLTPAVIMCFSNLCATAYQIQDVAHTLHYHRPKVNSPLLRLP